MPERTPVTIEPWEPFSEIDVFRGWPALRSFDPFRAAGVKPPTPWSPSADMSESDGHYVVTVELAGAKKEDVHVEVNEDVLTIRGEKKSERKDEGEQRHYSERSFGMFTRSFSLPSNANVDKVKATFEDGVLSIEIPKREDAKPKAIKVH